MHNKHKVKLQQNHRDRNLDSLEMSRILWNFSALRDREWMIGNGTKHTILHIGNGTKHTILHNGNGTKHTILHKILVISFFSGSDLNAQIQINM